VRVLECSILGAFPLTVGSDVSRVALPLVARRVSSTRTIVPEQRPLLSSPLSSRQHRSPRQGSLGELNHAFLLSLALIEYATITATRLDLGALTWIPILPHDKRIASAAPKLAYRSVQYIRRNRRISEYSPIGRRMSSLYGFPPYRGHFTQIHPCHNSEIPCHDHCLLRTLRNFIRASRNQRDQEPTLVAEIAWTSAVLHRNILLYEELS